MRYRVTFYPHAKEGKRWVEASDVMFAKGFITFWRGALMVTAFNKKDVENVVVDNED